MRAAVIQADLRDARLRLLADDYVTVAADLERGQSDETAALARGAGLEAVTVRRREDLGAVAEWVGGPRRPALLADAKVVPTVVAEWLDEAFRGH